MKTQLTKQKIDTTFETLKDKFSYSQKLAAPRMVKVVVNVGTGKKMKADPKFNELVSDRIMKITGQKPSIKAAKKSIAGFKIREGDSVGISVTLRGARMNEFVDKLIHIAIPRTKDFRGFTEKSVDNIGNLTIGIKEHTIFPETPDEDLKDIFGLSLTFVSTAKTHEEGIEFFKHLGIPFKKEEK